MKVLMVIPGLDKRLGGTTTLSIGFFKYLSQLTDVDLATVYANELEKNSIDKEYFSNNNVHIFLSNFSFYKYASSLKTYLNNNLKNYDVVHIHGLWHGASYLTASLALKAGVPYVISPHGMLEPDAFARSGWKKGLFWKLLYAQVFKKAVAIHCTATSEIENTYRFDPQANCIHVPNGVNLAVLPKKVEQGQQVVFMGRLHEKKGIDQLIKAIISFPNLKLKIAGSGSPSYEAFLQGLVKELDKNNQIEFIGFVDGEDKEKIFQESLFSVVPSFSEGLPLVALESLANATPLLITKASNVPEVSEFNCGIELENNEVPTIKSGIENMLQSDLAVMGKNARNLAEQKFHWPIVAKALYEEYKKVLQKLPS